MKKYFNFDTSYIELSKEFYQMIKPTPVKSPELFLYNKELSEKLDVLIDIDNKEISEILSGNKILNKVTLAQAYCGHQFSNFNILGDGRAILLGEHITNNGDRYDIQLKGAGKTNYSRDGDGRATLSSVLREYIISESMYRLGIDTSRSLAIVKTGESIYREKKYDAAILTRVAKSHLRIGTFQYAKLLGNDYVKELADYTIKRHYPNCEGNYLKLLREIMLKQTDLVINWLRVGFIHGVMNTDNIFVSGETLDYGPCAFMEYYSENKVYSSVDRLGRYSYGNQASINGWNMLKLSELFVPLISNNKKESMILINKELRYIKKYFRIKWFEMMGKKLGFNEVSKNIKDLIVELLYIMEEEKLDFTNTFIYLRSKIKKLNFDSDILINKKNNKFDNFIKKWKNNLKKSNRFEKEILELMENNNPIVIPRNLKVEEAIKEANNLNLDNINKLLDIMKKTYDYNFNDISYLLSSKNDKNYLTFCGN